MPTESTSIGAIRRAARRHAFQELARKHNAEFKAIQERELKKAGIKPKPKAAPKKKAAPKAAAKAA